MNNRRQFLKLLPLAAVTATTIQIDDVTAQVRELKPEKKYLIVISDLDPDDCPRITASLREKLGENVTVLAGSSTVDLKVYELQ